MATVIHFPIRFGTSRIIESMEFPGRQKIPPFAMLRDNLGQHVRKHRVSLSHPANPFDRVQTPAVISSHILIIRSLKSQRNSHLISSHPYFRIPTFSLIGPHSWELSLNTDRTDSPPTAGLSDYQLYSFRQ